MNRPSNSKDRFATFLEKFRSGQYKQKSLDDKSEPEDKDAAETKEDKNKRRGYLKQYIRQLWPHRKMVLLLVALAITVAVLEISTPLFGRYIIDQILLAEKTNAEKFWQLNIVGGLFLLVVFITRLCGMTRAWFQRLLNVRVILTLRRALFERLLKLPLDQLSDMKVGGIISRLTDDINKTTGLLQMAVVSPGVAVLRLVLAMGILVFINWKLAIAALGILPPIMLLSMIAIRRIRPVYRAIRKDVSFVDGRVGEAFSGIRDVRAFGGEHREETEFTLGHHTITRMRMFAASREILLWSCWGLLMGLTGVIITWLGGFWFVRGEATIGDITAFQFYVFMLLNPVWQIVESLTDLQRSLASMERVFEVLESPIDKPDKPDAIEAHPPVQSIELKDVRFAYNEGAAVIHDFNLKVKGGTVTALVGRSGAGKTTITDLVSRFYDPTHGQVLLNGHDLRDYKLKSYRDLLGVVQQEVFLFDGTVFENIAYGNHQATMEQVVEAAKQANAHEFIAELDAGYESLIGERGVKLSGGQRQTTFDRPRFVSRSKNLDP